MEFLVGFFGGLARVFLGLLDWQLRTKEPFQFDRFFQSILSALLTGGVFQLTMDVNFGTQELLIGWGTSEVINKGLSITGIGPFLSGFLKNSLTAFRS